MFRDLAIFSALLLLFALSQIIPNTNAQSGVCDTGTPEPIGCIYTGRVDGFLPIGEFIGFRNPDIPTQQPEYTDIGLITAYWWDVNSNRYGYHVLVQPYDRQAAIPYRAHKLVFPEQVLDGIDN